MKKVAIIYILFISTFSCCLAQHEKQIFYTLASVPNPKVAGNSYVALVVAVQVEEVRVVAGKKSEQETQNT